jgi:hypothetical protein
MIGRISKICYFDLYGADLSCYLSTMLDCVSPGSVSICIKGSGLKSNENLRYHVLVDIIPNYHGTLLVQWWVNEYTEGTYLAFTRPSDWKPKAARYWI